MIAKEMFHTRFLHPRFNHPCECFPAIEETLRDPSASHWIKVALAGALALNSVDVANDAEMLAGILGRWARHQTSDHISSA